MKNILFFKMYY